MIVIVGTTTTTTVQLLLLLLLLLIATTSTATAATTADDGDGDNANDNNECHMISHDRTCISFPDDINDDNKKYKYYEHMEDKNDYANNEDTNANTNTKEDSDEFVCGVYLAKSTLIGTGIGMYAGSKGYEPGEVITKRLGDHIIPIIDLKTTHQYYNPSQIYKDEEDDDEDDDDEDLEGTNAIIVPDNQHYFLWDQYTVRHKTKQEFV
jgi:hypothetical protein